MLDRKIAVVTGGSSGIGRAVSLRFAQEGATVVVADLRSEPREGGEPTDGLIRSRGGQALFAFCDVTDPQQVEAALDAADEVGGIDILFNGAGIFFTDAFLEVTEADFDRMMCVNLKAAFFVAQAAARRMERKRAGCIINVASSAGLRGAGAATVYCASKGAVRLMSLALAEALGGVGIRVNAICPGIVRTSMTTVDAPILGTGADASRLATVPVGRFGEPDDIAGAALYLASELSAYVSGTSLLVDGGQLRI
jgi:NAD(P)-dependent dehydrogenase (short-subunit alcohol dehydrogenase family)